jgi:PAS domain S-box-containing protein
VASEFVDWASIVTIAVSKTGPSGRPLLYSSAPQPLLNGATVSAAVLALSILALDLLLPSDVDVGVLYVVPLLVGTLNGPPKFQLVAAAIASLLTVISPLVTTRPITNLVVVNRAIALIVLWTTAIVLSRFRGTWLALQTRTKDLADVKYALDQSAIVAITDTKGTIKFVNDKFCEISKYLRNELLGQDHRILNSGYHPKEFIRNLWVTIANGKIWHGEIRNKAKDGSIYWVDTTIVPFLDEDGKPYQYMAIRYEITERKRTEALLQEQAALARLGQMAAVVAHEVKNPIAGIRGALQVIASRMPEQSRDRAVVGDIIARLDGLNGIVQDLLVFARPRPLKAEPVDLKSLVTSTADMIKRDPGLSHLQIDVAGPDAVVHADGEQLRIVFQNILMNAAQAMDGSGCIDVGIRQSAPQEWLVSFTDRGPGMPDDVREKAFEAFFTTKHRGTGLGLPTARRIIEAHGGRIQIDALPSGSGTVVSIWLPAAA